MCSYVETVMLYTSNSIDREKSIFSYDITFNTLLKISDLI